MSLALWLRDRGHDVTLIEGSDRLGGLAAPWELGDVTWDRHYHVILNSDSHLLALIERLGLEGDLRWVETRTGVYTAGNLYSVSNTLEYLRFPPLRSIDKARIGWTILYGSRLKDWRRLERTSVESWLRKHSGDRAFEAFWLPLLRSKLGDNYSRTSAAFIWATIQRLYAARRSGLKKEMFGYVTGGYATIIERFLQALLGSGVSVRTATRVTSVGRHGDGVVVETDDGTLRFDRVVVTAPAPVAARLIDGLGEQEAALLDAVDYQGIVCASVLSRRGLAGFYVTNITDPAPFTGVIEMSALVDRAEFGGRHLIYLPRYTTAEESAISDAEVESLFLTALAEMFPGFDETQVEAFRVSRVPHVFPIPTLGYSEKVPPVATSVPGVYTVNSAQILNGTLNVNETLQLAARALPVLTGEVGYDRALLERPVQPVLVPAPA
jgi:protoporphyrinogen oxidase